MDKKRRRRTPKKQSFLQKIPVWGWVGLFFLLVAAIVVLAVTLNREKPTDQPEGYVENAMFSGGYAAVQKEGKWGFVNTQGKSVIPPIYDQVRSFQENGLAAVQKDGKWGYIDSEGKTVVEFIYQAAEDFSQGRAAVMLGSHWGYITEGGMNITESKYQSAGEFSDNGLAMIRYNNAYGYIDTQGKEVIPAIYESAASFANGADMAMVSQGGLYGYIDRNGQTAIDFRFSALGPFYCGLAPAKTDGQFGYIDKTGNFVIQPEFDYAYAFSKEGVAKVTVAGKSAFINTSGALITQAHFTSVDTFQQGFAVVSIDGKQALLKPDGTYSIAPCDYQFPKSVSEGLLVYRDSAGLYGFMDTEGNILVTAQFTQAESFRKDGYAAVQKDGKWGIVDKQGKLIVQPQYESIY